MTPSSKKAIGRLDVLDSTRKRIDWGTAFLAGPRLLLTAYHVVADREEPAWVPKGAHFEVTFARAGGCAIRVAPEPIDADPVLDFAALELLDDAPADIEPLVISTLRPRDGVAFAAWGFPRLNAAGGFDVSGRVSDSGARLDGNVPVVQMYALEAAAPDAVMTGLSGGPCLSEDRVFALVRSFPTTDGQRAAGGTLYACPTYELVTREKIRTRLRLDPCAGLPPLPSDYPWPQHPYLDLLPYSENHARVFFGRCAEISRLLHLTSEEPRSPVLLCGQTGVGKSSLLRAGVLPRAKRRWNAQYAARDRETGLAGTLGTLLKAVDAPLPRLLVIDQLEESLTRPREGEPHELRDFAFAVVRHLASEPRDRIVLSFRKEWLAEIERVFADHGTVCPVMLVEPLNDDAIFEVAVAVARDPALRQRWNLAVDEEAAREIVARLASDVESAIAPALQVLLTRLWKKSVAKSRATPHITIELVRAAADDGLGLGDVLDARLVRLYEELPEVADGLALDVLEFHTTAVGTADTRTKAVRDETYGARSATVDALVIGLHEHFLLVDPRGELPGAARLAHDALAPLVRARFLRSRLSGQRARRLLEGRGSEAPLHEHDLAIVEAGLAHMRKLSSGESTLLEASRARLRKKVRVATANRLAVGGLLGALLLALLIAKSQVDARREREIALQTAQYRTQRVDTLKANNLGAFEIQAPFGVTVDGARKLPSFRGDAPWEPRERYELIPSTQANQAGVFTCALPVGYYVVDYLFKGQRFAYGVHSTGFGSDQRIELPLPPSRAGFRFVPGGTVPIGDTAGVGEESEGPVAAIRLAPYFVSLQRSSPSTWESASLAASDAGASLPTAAQWEWAATLGYIPFGTWEWTLNAGASGPYNPDDGRENGCIKLSERALRGGKGDTYDEDSQDGRVWLESHEHPSRQKTAVISELHPYRVVLMDSVSMPEDRELVAKSIPPPVFGGRALLFLRIPPSFELTARAQSELGGLASRWCRHPFPRPKLTIEGRVAAFGTDEYNLVISQKLAAMVRERLLFEGLPPGAVDTVGAGETRALDNTDYSSAFGDYGVMISARK